MDPKEFERASAAILALFPPLAETQQRLSMALYRLRMESRMRRLTVGRAAEEWAGRHRAARIATLQQAWELGRRHNALRYARQPP